MGFNRATRSANIAELFSPQAFALGGSSDPCTGDMTAPGSPTPEQCAYTGVTPEQYGNLAPNPAGREGL